MTMTMTMSKAPPVHHHLVVSLEELYTGKKKRVRIMRRVSGGCAGTTAANTSTNNSSSSYCTVSNPTCAHSAPPSPDHITNTAPTTGASACTDPPTTSSPTTVTVTAIDREIMLQSEWMDGMQITLACAGDDLEPGSVIPADVVFTLVTRSHERFDREGADLIYWCTCSLNEALSTVTQSVVTLDQRVLHFSLPYVTPDTVHTIRGEGMARSNNRTPTPAGDGSTHRSNARGDLQIRFRIVFPDSLQSNPLKRKAVVDVLDEAQHADADTDTDADSDHSTAACCVYDRGNEDVRQRRPRWTTGLVPT